jgi:Fuc2NAc and GlcNAc transferase
VTAATWIASAVVAFASALAGVWLVERNAARLRLVDLPNVRSSHLVPRPRGGGLGILVGVASAAAVTVASGASWAVDGWILLGGALLVAAVGLWDDISRLGIWSRLVVQTLAAGFVVATLGGVERLPLPPPADAGLGMAGPLLTVLWIVGVTNFFNFMDGFDGLAGGQAVISLGALTWALWPQAAAGLTLVVLAATAGFLVRNWSPARIFLGDVGSAFLGFLLAGLPLTGAAEARPQLVFLVAISMTLFLLDPVVTLIMRGRRRAAFGVSHRDHAYQQLVPPGRPHAAAVSVLLAAGLALALVAVGAFTRPALAWPVVGVALIAFAIEWQVAARRRGDTNEARMKARPDKQTG